MNRRSFITYSVGAFAFGLPSLSRAQNNTFLGYAELRSLPGQYMQLLSRFSFRDPQGLLWSVPKGYKSDGASIPRAVWALAGGPWAGSYKDAAIIHDYYCDTMSRSWEATHKVFHHGMLARGVDPVEAKIKYEIVDLLGPRWDSTHRWTGKYGKKRLRGATGISFSFDPSKRIARSIASSRQEAWELEVARDVEARIRSEGAANFSSESYAPPTIFDYDVALTEAQQSVDQYATINDRGQVLMPTEQMLQFQTNLSNPALNEIGTLRTPNM
ncbi:DUF1353 domain-containing protein [Erythrobacter sp. F6033]|uniref:DUF1353 domain-containing protein n=1 Tax=Erythrobacter sp. F6033 TaxID=2926401 RepID=UPI001FF5AF51|nr:DUF1353 domain-containing protein [Erythrobacter sp. F6033]MCK0127107.1 DUF1353 domain-containing protein [Erythrobacter sp. F6033]